MDGSNPLAECLEADEMYGGAGSKGVWCITGWNGWSRGSKLTVCIGCDVPGIDGCIPDPCRNSGKPEVKKTIPTRRARVVVVG